LIKLSRVQQIFWRLERRSGVSCFKAAEMHEVASSTLPRLVASSCGLWEQHVPVWRRADVCGRVGITGDVQVHDADDGRVDAVDVGLKFRVVVVAVIIRTCVASSGLALQHIVVASPAGVCRTRVAVGEDALSSALNCRASLLEQACEAVQHGAVQALE